MKMNGYLLEQFKFLRWILSAARLAALSLLLGSCWSGQAVIVNARSGSLGDVAAAVARAANGDTVDVPPGESVWEDSLTISKPITLRGAGIGRTIIRCRLKTDKPMLIFETRMGGFYRLTGLEFRGVDQARKFGKGCVLFRGTTKTFRLDHCKFDGVRNRSTVFRNALCGVIDHNIFIARTANQQITIYHDSWGGQSWGDGSWASPIDWGGPNAIYIEDNSFASDPPNHYAFIDEYAGARFVFRHNTVTNMTLASHGTGSTGRNRGVRQWEIYNNTFIANPPTAGNAIHMRGGTGVVFNNTVFGFGKFLTLHTYRYHTSFRHWSGSDGTSAWDLNDRRVCAMGVAGPGSGIGPDGTGGKLVVPGAGWAPGQWVGYLVQDLDGLRNIQPRGDRGEGARPFFSTVMSNTTDTILVRAGSQRPNKIFAPGDRFEIRRVLQGLDMIGASTGDLLVGKDPSPRWLKQSIEPVYVWNNTKDGVANTGVATADPPIKEGVHFFDNKSKPEYKPFVYPHPLVTSERAPSLGN